jgi:tRNA A37 threonylcarbamoyladenosine dehydratase
MEPSPAAFAIAPDEADLARRFAGVARLYGEGTAAFRAARVVVVGIGGVGSWAAEALARSGVGAITLIDLDHIAESNTNRQIHALEDDYGKAKVTAMAARIAAINPGCLIEAIEQFVSEDNVAALLPRCDAVLDCIDQVSAKAALIAYCRAQGVVVVTCGGAGGRTDPTRIRRDDLARASGDPLLAKVRYRLRRRYGFARERGGRVPKFGVIAVFSDEPVRPPATVEKAGSRDLVAGLACAGYGSAVTVTAPFGFTAAGAALDALAGFAMPRAASASEAEADGGGLCVDRGQPRGLPGA